MTFSLSPTLWAVPARFTGRKTHPSTIPALEVHASCATFTHVGIYVGNDQFVHATRPGSPLQVTPLDADYYRDRYMTAVRLSPR